MSRVFTLVGIAVLWQVLASIVGCNQDATAHPVLGGSASQFATLGSRGLASGQFVEPRAIASDRDNRTYVIDKSGRVQRFSASGKLQTAWRVPKPNGTKGAPSGICVDNQGRVLVADTHQHRILIYDANGNELLRFGRRGTDSGHFMFPTDVAVDSTGCIYVAEFGGNDRVSKFSPTGRFLLEFGTVDTGEGALMRPSGLTVDDEDYVWIADTGNHRICKFTAHGELEFSIGDLGTSSGQFRYPRDVVLLDEDTLAIVDSGNNRIVIRKKNGDVLFAFGSAGRGEDEFHTPVNGCKIGNRLYIADSENDRIVAFTYDSATKNSVETDALSSTRSGG